LRMTLGEGVSGAYVGNGVTSLDPISKNSGEKEVLLPTNCRMLVTRIRPVSELTSEERTAGWGSGSAKFVADVTVLPTT
ncbi:MAG: hypothetical protein J0626_02435, partial [Rhodospirillaceae bacterium]|nr:hypothetical protein [Rhodospirillaceae bacterium]